MNAELLILAVFAGALALNLLNTLFSVNLFASTLIVASAFVASLGLMPQAAVASPYETLSLTLLTGLLFLVTSAHYNGNPSRVEAEVAEKQPNPLATIVPSTVLMGTHQATEPDTLAQAQRAA